MLSQVHCCPDICPSFCAPVRIIRVGPIVGAGHFDQGGLANAHTRQNPGPHSKASPMPYHRNHEPQQLCDVYHLPRENGRGAGWHSSQQTRTQLCSQYEPTGSRENTRYTGSLETSGPTAVQAAKKDSHSGSTHGPARTIRSTRKASRICNMTTTVPRGCKQRHSR